MAASCIAFQAGRTSELPAPRPKKLLPERQASLLVIHCYDRILLEARPPAGIWGGLLSLPELPEGEDASDYCLRRFGLQVETVTQMPAVWHGFTHFRLRIDPLLCKVVATGAQLSEPGWRWLEKPSLAQAALPAPVRKLLSAIP